VLIGAERLTRHDRHLFLRQELLRESHSRPDLAAHGARDVRVSIERTFRNVRRDAGHRAQPAGDVIPPLPVLSQHLADRLLRPRHRFQRRHLRRGSRV
jgi:hypothetical protein